MILIISGDGVVANVTLNKPGMKGADSIQTTFTWSLAVILPMFIFGATSGAHFNLAPTIALAVDGSMSQGLVLGYIVAQSVDTFMGAVAIYLLFKDQRDATGSATIKLGTFCTGPPVSNVGCNILSEAVETFVLVFAVKDIGQVPSTAPGVDELLVFGIIVSIGMSLDGPTGYAISSTRDLGPRLAHAVLPIKGKGDPNWGYAPVVIIGPVVGAVVAALLYQATP